MMCWVQILKSILLFDCILNHKIENVECKILFWVKMGFFFWWRQLPHLDYFQLYKYGPVSIKNDVT